eukprot:comp22304_c0_seq3/m.33110 comp22304_c0_seq3/g.33110  ORF comp22304_c0_seq3/g.33110 comp22304_c0_seq3/m.33110 type:complete len:147 (-) comp22304_c0_seq3:137-577(-)
MMCSSGSQQKRKGEKELVCIYPPFKYFNNLSRTICMCLSSYISTHTHTHRMCYQADNKSTSCPVCLPPVNQLAEGLPFSHRIQSILVCRITGDVINDHNPPCALPNGYVYGTRGLQEMADRNKGYVTCPRTKERFHISELKKVFIM